MLEPVGHPLADGTARGRILRLGGLAVALVLGLSAPAAGELIAQTRSVTLEWSPSSGPVAGYMVLTSVNGGPLRWRAQTSEPRYKLTGDYGTTVRVAVVPHDANLELGPRSPLSAPIEFRRSSEPGDRDGTFAEDPGVLGDVDADGYADLVWRTDPGTARIWLMSGDGLGVSRSVFAPAGTGWRVVGAGHLEGNAQGNLLWFRPRSGELRVQRLREGSPVAAHALPSALSDWSVAGVADFDADGDDDILWHHAPTGRNGVWPLHRGRYTRQVELPDSANGWSVAGVGDFDGDLDHDILWHHSRSGANAIWLLEDSRFVQQNSLPASVAGWSVTDVADLDGDGIADLLWHHAETGGNVLWLVRNGTFTRQTELPKTARTWRPEAARDLDGDGAAEILWREGSSDGLRSWDLSGGVFSEERTLPSAPSGAELLE